MKITQKALVALALIQLSQVFSIANVSATNTDGTCDSKDGSSVCSEPNEGGHDLKIVPFVFPVFGYNKGRRILNQTPGNYQPGKPGQQQEQQQQQQDDLTSIVPAATYNLGGQVAECEEDSYIVEDSVSKLAGIAAGIAVTTAQFSTAPLTGAFVGLFPSYSSNGKSVRHVTGRSNAEKLHVETKMPATADDALEMNEGDSVTYSTTGGIELFAGASVFGAMVNGNIGISGTWKVKIVRLPENKVQFIITKESTKSIGGKTGVILLANVRAGIEKNLSKSIVVELDLDDEAAKLAYSAVLSGSISHVQDLVEKENNPNVKITRTIDEDTYTKSKGVRVGLPFVLSKSFSVNSGFSTSNILDHEDDTFSDVHSTTYDIASDSQRLRFSLYQPFKHASLHRNANGASFVTTSNVDGKLVDKGILGEANVVYDNDHSSFKDSQSALNYIKNFMLDPKEIDLMFPTFKQIGSVRMHYKITIPSVAVKSLSAALSSSDNTALLQSISSVVDEYFLNGDARGVCEGYKNEGKCQDIVKAEAIEIAKLATSTINDMTTEGKLSADQQGQYMAYLSQLARNFPFLRAALIQLAPEITETFSAEGRDFKKFVRHFHY
jgi:hypothetical protein